MSALPEKYSIGANLTFLRILRVARLVRLVRLFTIFKPLTVLFLALIDGLKTLLWAAVLLVILLLLFALVIVFLDESKGSLRSWHQLAFRHRKWRTSYWLSCDAWFWTKCLRKL